MGVEEATDSIKGQEEEEEEEEEQAVVMESMAEISKVVLVLGEVEETVRVMDQEALVEAMVSATVAAVVFMGVNSEELVGTVRIMALEEQVAATAASVVLVVPME